MAKPIIGISPRIKEKNGLYSVKENFIEYVNKLGCKHIVFQPVFDAIKDYVKDVNGILLMGAGYHIHPSFYNEDILFEKEFMEKLLTEFEIELIKEAEYQKKPILAICHGFQMLNIAFNGTLYQSIPDQVGRKVIHQNKSDVMHNIRIEKNTLLSKILKKGECSINSNHNQGIKDVGKTIRACAFSDDGLCEAIEHIEAEFIIGVQWHPERLKKKSYSRIGNAFVEACKKNM